MLKQLAARGGEPHLRREKAGGAALGLGRVEGEVRLRNSVSDVSFASAAAMPIDRVRSPTV